MELKHLGQFRGRTIRCSQKLDGKSRAKTIYEENTTKKTREALVKEGALVAEGNEVPLYTLM